MWEVFWGAITNPFILFIGAQQVLAGGYSYWLGDWRIATISVAVGIANLAMSSLSG